MNIIVEGDPSTGIGTLWLGDYTAAMNKPTLKQHGIRTVLTTAQGLGIFYPQNCGIHHKTYNVLDIESANISRIWADTYVQISEGLQRGGVLVHCAAGVSRSASTVIAYLMKKNGWKFQESLNYVKKKRSIICPNFGFQRQLRQFERELMKNNGAQTSQVKQRSGVESKEIQRRTFVREMQNVWNGNQQRQEREEKQESQNQDSTFQKAKSEVKLIRKLGMPQLEKIGGSQGVLKPIDDSKYVRSQQISGQQQRRIFGGTKNDLARSALYVSNSKGFSGMDLKGSQFNSENLKQPQQQWSQRYFERNKRDRKY